MTGLCVAEPATNQVSDSDLVESRGSMSDVLTAFDHVGGSKLFADARKMFAEGASNANQQEKTEKRAIMKVRDTMLKGELAGVPGRDPEDDPESAESEPPEFFAEDKWGELQPNRATKSVEFEGRSLRMSAIKGVQNVGKMDWLRVRMGGRINLEELLNTVAERRAKAWAAAAKRSGTK